METTTTNGKVLQGIVVKAAMKDTCTVSVQRYVKHPKYEKYLKRTKKFLVHDAGNTAKVGDTVEIRETKPMSKHKHFTLGAIVTAAAIETE
ncbi:MAG: 30S ribosomal protein S17 [Minisyncoccia bacterium]